MSAEIFLFSHQPLGYARGDLEDDIEELLGEAGEVTGGGSGLGGWNIDISMADGVPHDEWVARLTAFLRQRGVPADTFMEVLPPDWVVGQASERVEVYPR